MAARHEDVDLEIVLNDPKCARQWIKDFDWGRLEAPKYVVFGIEDRIYLGQMTDAEAVLAAHIILRDVEIPMNFRTKELLEETEVH
jgi:hypothetical protein